MATRLDLLLDDNGVVLRGGDWAFAIDREGIQQRISQVLKTIAGEWFLDLDYGLPYFEQVLVKNPNLPAVQDIFRRALLSVKGVSSVERLTLSLDTTSRTLTVSWVVLTDLGLLVGTDNISPTVTGA
jgi:hypothetical protein